MIHTKTKEEALLELGAKKDFGLTNDQVKARQKKFGKNKLVEAKPPSAFFIFLKQFNNFFTIVLLVAALLSLILREFFDLLIILVAVAFNIIIGFVQELKAAKTIYALRQIVVIRAKVLRSGKIHQILAEDLVPGDIIFIESGDKIPADARLLETVSFFTKEAILTGESIPSKKKADKVFPEKTPLADRENMVYMGTMALAGKATAVVCAIGTKSELGKIAKLVREVKEKPTPLQARMRSLGQQIAIIAFASILLILFGGLSLGISIHEMFLTAVALAVAVIPEGLLVTVVVILTLGMRRILQKKALVRELLAAETLGSTTVICTDKTGTITSGEMRVEKILTHDQEFLEKNFRKEKRGLFEIFKTSLFCNDVLIENDQGPRETWKFLGNPTEVALLYAARLLGMRRADFEKDYRLLDEIPFDSYLKYMAEAWQNLKTKKTEFYVKGSAERTLSFSSSFLKNGEVLPLDEKTKEKFLAQNAALSEKGFRVLACGAKTMAFRDEMDMKKEAASGLTFLGLVAIRDPIRKNIKEAVKKCYEAGIKIKMITGDHKKTALAISREIGIEAKEEEILTGEDLDFTPPEELTSKIIFAKIFARVAPKHKLQIVEALQEKKEIVAMTGDGVNDTPALKAANIGIAMGKGSEAAQEASGMILLDNNFKSIEEAVEEGRVIFDNIRKVTLYLLLYAFAKVVLVGGAMLFGLPLPLLPVQILWMNIVEDGLPDFALAFEREEKEVMKEKPKKIEEQILDPKTKILIFLVGLPASILLFSLYFFLFKWGYEETHLRSLIFVSMALTSVITAYNCRSLKTSLFKNRLFSNRFLNLAVVFSLLLLVLAVYLPPLQAILKTKPLGFVEWLLALGFAASNMAAIELVKRFFQKNR